MSDGETSYQKENKENQFKGLERVLGDDIPDRVQEANGLHLQPKVDGHHRVKILHLLQFLRHILAENERRNSN